MEVAIRLNIDPRKADQALRGLAVLPHGIGKQMRIVVFAEGPAADAALAVKIALACCSLAPAPTPTAPRVEIFHGGQMMWKVGVWQAGASAVGTDDLVEKIKEGFLDFDRAVATPSCVLFSAPLAPSP